MQPARGGPTKGTTDKKFPPEATSRGGRRVHILDLSKSTDTCVKIPSNTLLKVKVLIGLLYSSKSTSTSDIFGMALDAIYYFSQELPNHNQQ